MEIEEAKRIWTETITTTLLKGFSENEWDTLVENFKQQLLTQLPSSKIIGYSFSTKNASKFTKKDIPRLLNDAFESSPLNNAEGWTLEDTAFGAKNLFIESRLFGERLLAHGAEPPPKRLKDDPSTSMGKLLEEFMETQTTKDEIIEKLSRFEVWLSFHYWASKKRGGENLYEDYFYRIFEEIYPQFCDTRGKKRYYKGFSIHLRHAPRYPSS
jgi:hypothetical protein